MVFLLVIGEDKTTVCDVLGKISRSHRKCNQFTAAAAQQVCKGAAAGLQ
jgi:hypothetical protein